MKHVLIILLGLLLLTAGITCKGEDLRGTVGNSCKPDGTCVGKLVCRLGKRDGSLIAFYGCDVPDGP